MKEGGLLSTDNVRAFIVGLYAAIHTWFCLLFLFQDKRVAAMKLLLCRKNPQLQSAETDIDISVTN